MAQPEKGADPQPQQTRPREAEPSPWQLGSVSCP